MLIVLLAAISLGEAAGKTKTQSLSSRSDFELTIPERLTTSRVITETRVRVRFLEGAPLGWVLEFEQPNYKLESWADCQWASPSLEWAQGAEHVLLPDSAAEVAPHFGAKEYRISLEGEVLNVAKTGTTFTLNRMAGWRFESDPVYPLTFKVVSGGGYVYLCGKGRVVSSAGEAYRFGQQDTVDSMVVLLKSTDDLTREGAAQALGWIGDSTAIYALAEALRDSVPLVRRSAAESLGKIGHVSGLEPLSVLYDDDHKWTAATARWAYYEIVNHYRSR